MLDRICAVASIGVRGQRRTPARSRSNGGEDVRALPRAGGAPGSPERVLFLVLLHLLAGNLMTCTCQGCGRAYTVDLMIPDEVWERIKPDGKGPGAGLL